MRRTLPLDNEHNTYMNKAKNNNILIKQVHSKLQVVKYLIYSLLKVMMENMNPRTF